MKKVNVIYWAFTGLFAALMLLSSIPDVIVHPLAVEVIVEHLGYPTYFVPFLGVAKVLGVIALLAPGLPRLKEWAYAGFVYDFAAAAYSHITVSRSLMQGLIVLPPLILLAGSYFFYHRRLKAKRVSSLIEPLPSDGFVIARPSTKTSL